MRQGHRMMIKLERFAILVATLAMLPALPSCVYDHYDAQVGDDGISAELTIRTRAVTEHDGYEVGTEYESYIDIAGGDYRIYFFTYSENEDSNNKLICEFFPKDLYAVSGSDYTEYSMFGTVDETIAGHSDFKVVVLANWGEGHYPTELVTISEDESNATTIDDLCDGDNSTFLAETFLSGVDSTHLIPFFGLREYTGVEWKNGWRTTLSGEITLLRSVAKVEVVMSEDSDIDSFDDVSIVRYNESGYCAPAGVYLRSDYDHGYSWDNDFTDNVHLVGGRNSDNNGTAPLSRQSASGTDVWTIYLPEYDNTSSSSDYSFIQVKIDGEEYEIYFANYEDGVAANTADYDIFRNCVYRFTVTYNGARIYVYVTNWNYTEEVLDFTGGGEQVQ